PLLGAADRRRHAVGAAVLLRLPLPHPAGAVGPPPAAGAGVGIPDGGPLRALGVPRGGAREDRPQLPGAGPAAFPRPRGRAGPAGHGASGPYICSETDGGGLPWWLHGDADGAPAALRTTDPDYLAAVDRWFAAVMPILADAQVTRGGAVALVQIENELDFFDCPDPEQYMDHLAARARQHGIEVPLIACAGQGDLAGASGDVDGVVPTVNLYPDDASTTFDEETRRYADVAAQRD